MAAFYNQKDQDIYKTNKFMPQSKFLFDTPTNIPVEEKEKVTESFGIPNTNAFTNSGGGGGNNFSNSPYTAQPSGSFVTNRTSYGDYLPGTRPEPSKFQPAMDLIGKGIGMAIPGGNFLMGMAKQNSRENKLNAYDNAFIDMQLANQEQSVHGGGNLTNQDRYGYNKVSAFGNYADLVSKNAAKANAKNTEDLTDFDRYYQEKEKERKDKEDEEDVIGGDIKDQIDFNNFVRQRITANNIRKGIKKGTIDEGFNIHGDGNITGGGGEGFGGYANVGAYDKANQATYDRISDMHSGGGGGSSGGFTNPGKGSYGPHMATGGRAGYFFGGRVNYKVGGRTDAGANRSTASKAGVGQINESGQKVSGGNFNNNDGGNNNPPVTVVEDQTSIFDTSGLKSKSPEIGFNYTDPKNYASLKGSVYNKNILDNDDINVKGNLSGEIGPVSYDTSFTDQGITGTNLKAGNFTTNLNPDMQVQNIGYNKGPFNISSDGQNTTAGLKFSYKNGGLAGLL